MWEALCLFFIPPKFGRPTELLAEAFADSNGLDWLSCTTNAPATRQRGRRRRRFSFFLFFSFVLGREKAPVETEHGAISARKGIPQLGGILEATQWQPYPCTI